MQVFNNIEKKDYIIGNLGLLIPIAVIFSYSAYFMFLNPIAFKNINKINLFLYNGFNVPGREWDAYFSHIFIGALMVIFMSLLIYFKNNNLFNLISKILLLVSGIGWLTFGLFPYSIKTWEQDFNHILLINTITMFSGTLGFLLYGVEKKQIGNRKSINLIVHCIGWFLLIENSIGFTIGVEYPNSISKLAWLIYFIGFGLIGLSVIKRAPKTL